MLLPRSLGRFFACLCFVLAVGCGGSGESDESAPASCEAGQLGCACDDGDTCSGGLTCLSSLCVDAGSLVDPHDCTAGSLGCACDDGECDAALTCLSELCVDAGDLQGGTGGSGGTGGGESSGSGGSVTGSGGASGSGGAGGVGEAGGTGGTGDPGGAGGTGDPGGAGGADESGGAGGADDTGGAGGADDTGGAGGTAGSGGTGGTGATGGTGGTGGSGGTGGTSPGACNEIVHPVRGTLTLATLRGIEAAGDLVYASAGTKIHVVDISDPDAPAVVGDLEVLTTASASELYMVQGYAIVLDDEVLRVVDLSTPSAPTLASSYPVTGINSPGIASDGQYLYVTTDATLQALALQDGALEFAGEVPTADRAYDLAAGGGYAYAIISGTVHVFDVSTPEAPAFAGAYADANSYSAISGLTEDYLFIQASTSSVGGRALSLADPTTPASVAEWSWGTKVQQVGDRLVMGSGSNVVELTNDDQFTTIRAIGASFSTSTDMAMAGDTVVTAGSNQLTVITRSRMPVYVAFGPDEQVLASALHGNILYYATTTSSVSSSGAIKMLDFTDPKAPVDLGAATGSASNGRQLVVSDGRLYAASSISLSSSDYVLSTYSLDDPTNPQLQGSTTITGGVSNAGFSVESDVFVGVRAYPRMFVTMDMTDPSAVSIVGSGDLAGTHWATVRHGNYAIVTTDGNSAADYTDVFLITDPAAPVRVVHSLDAIGTTFYQEGDTLYAIRSSTIGVYDISSLPAIIELGTGSIQSYTGSRKPSGSKFSHYLSTGTGSLVDVSDPANPTFVLSERLGGRAPYHISHALNGYQLLMGDHGWVVVDYCP